uniref:Coiled-coil and C2 domain containing 2B n=1 Tax=Callorhinchus milii TaxID=7868 RepID=A0A4W3JHN1_CALMI
DLYLSDYLLSDILERVPAAYESRKEREKQTQNLFNPRIFLCGLIFQKLLDISKQILFLVPSSSKLPENVEPRYLEEEGFHICHKPYVLKKNLNKMENRLLKQTEKEDWFGEDGNMIALPDPIKKLWNYTLPTSYLSDDFESKLETVYRKAVKSDSGHHIVTTIRATHIYQLDIDISSLRFTHHPLFSKEHVLAARLTQLYNNYQHRQQQNVTEVLTEKVTISNSINFVSLPKSGILISVIRAPSLETRRLLAVEREKDHTLIKNILTVWKQIKSLRKFQQFCFPLVILITFCKSVDEYTDYDLEKTPEPSAPLDRAAIEAMVKRRYKLISRQRDELILIPELSLTADVTLISKCFWEEVQRRMEIEEHKFFINIFYNEKLVSSTAVCKLQLDFHVQFKQIFNIQIIHDPESIRLEVIIHEITSKMNNILANVFVPIPEVTLLTGSAVLEEIEFSSAETVSPSHEGVGSNTLLFLDEYNSEPVLLMTSGIIICAVSWGIDKNGNALSPPAPRPKSFIESDLNTIDAIASIGVSWLNDIQKLAEWAKKARIDPHDPQNSSLMQLIEVNQHALQYFRLEQMQEEFNFVTDKEMEKSKRFLLLILRDSGVSEYSYFKQVPPYDKEIPDNRKFHIFFIMTYSFRVWCAVFITIYIITLKVKATVVKRLLTVKHQYTLADIVVESAEVSTISKAILNLITPRQNLKPLRKERKKVPVQTLSDGDIKMLINIITAYNIPMRKFQPFVEVTFQRSTYQTSIADGTQPCWNQKLEVDFKSPNGDYNGAMLCKMKDKIFINVFDSVILENIENDCYKSCTVKPRIKHWLGSITIPFNTILQQSKVSGTFKMNTPPMLLGYTWKKKEAGSCEEYFEFGLTEGSLLTLFITLDPQISCLDEVSFHFILETIEDEKIIQLAYQFQKECEDLFPKRSLITSVIDSECRVGFVTRYIRPLAPSPQLLEAFPKNSQATLRLIARFVSLIPFIPSSLKISNSCNIWLTSQQFLNLAVGDEAEHAVLLCNYFLHMGMKAFIILGNSIFAGATVNVITQEKTNTMIWNPETGECFEQFNAFCSLQTVGSLINNENIWFNVQKNNNLMNVSFDVSRENNWHPFFRKSSSHRVLTSVQPQELVYYSTERSIVIKLQNRIEWALKNKIMEWRAHQPTRWNRYCATVLYNALPILEQNLGQPVSEEYNIEIESLLKDYKVSGFPIQMRYTELQMIIEKVNSTGVHNIDLPNIEFALAVYIHPYPNNILSVWIYVASLFPDI